MLKEEAKRNITELVKKYESLNERERKAFNEANTKQGFIIPLFAAIGWDMNETKEVTLEETASAGRVDFAFKLNDVAQFYLEAKKLNTDLNNPDFLKQAITYAYNNGVTWAVLTNFDELRLINSQKSTPFITLTYVNYVKDFDKLWLLSRESFASGLLAKEATTYGALTPLVPIEEKLFRQLRQWREELYNQLFHYNEWLMPEHRDEIIEKLFNRLIFIRTCEDRKLEEHQLLSSFRQWEKHGHKKDELYEALRKIFKYYRGYYDSDLFKEHILDGDKLIIEETTVGSIMIGLYDIPGGMASYDFSIIDADVLGRVYEQYLGYVASAVKAKAKEAQTKLDLGFAIETDYQLMEKKQHRKEQGIYYTPKFVTDYIVKETVGRFLKEHNHNEILNMKILDPACGSGSFLIRAYDELLNYHADIKNKHPSQLDQYERLPILTRNIFGVDLDKQAVEIACLNLLLRSLAKRDLLPPLTDNIKQGNSLISGTADELTNYFGKGLKDKHSFNWEDEFKDIMGRGGFDIVIGNPPYVRIQSLSKEEADYFRSQYNSAFGSFDIYVLFIERAIKLLKSGGLLGFITSGKFLKSEYGKKIQQIVNEKCTVEAIIDLSVQQVFAEATTYPLIIIMHKGAEKKPLNYVFVPDNLLEPIDLTKLPTITAEQGALIKGVWPLSTSNNKLIEKLTDKATPLNDISERIFQGIKTSADDVYSLRLIKESDDYVTAFSKSLQKRVDLEKSLARPLIKTGQMKRYYIEKPQLVVLFPYINGELIPLNELESGYPKAWDYLNENIEVLKKREHGLFQNNENEWYQYGRNQALRVITLPKIITPDFAPSARYSLDVTGEYFFNGGTAGGYGILPKNGANRLFLLGLLNSKVLDWYLKKTSTNFQGGWFSYESRFIRHIPIRQINFTNLVEKNDHDTIVSLVEKMLKLNKDLQEVELGLDEWNEIKKNIEQTNDKIDNLVFDLYELNEEEREIVIDSQGG